MTCDHCGFIINPQNYEMSLRVCPECGLALTAVPTEPNPVVNDSSFSAERPLASRPLAPNFATPKIQPKTPSEAHTPFRPLQEHKLEFTGSAGEFFRIWIVNIFLSVITLGIYNAWAKVRTRRYFHAHTKLAGHAFDYLAEPTAILKGNLLVGAGLIAYSLSQQFMPLLSLGLLLVGYLIFPWLVYKSLRFKARYTAYRGIRFVFHGRLSESYTNYLWLPLLSIFTAGLIIPYYMFRQKRYFMENMAFGTTRNTFTADAGRFYTVYLQAFAIGVVAYGVGMAGIIPALLSGALNENAAFSSGALVSIVLGYAVILVLGAVLQQFIYARITNYSFQTSRLGELRFHSTLNVGALVRIRLSNALAIIFSLGLAIPWAMVRHAAYVLNNITVRTQGELDSFTADVLQDEDALGDVAADAFDFEVGL